MLTKPTPRWILLGGGVLAAFAGAVNAVGFLGLHHQALSHLSGSVTNVGMEIARADWQLAGHALLIVVFFSSAACSAD